MTNKAFVIDALQNLPDDATLNDIRERVEFITAVQVGLEQIRRGEVVSLDVVEAELESWVSGKPSPG